jgi:hypothetical protein
MHLFVRGLIPFCNSYPRVRNYSKLAAGKKEGNDKKKHLGRGPPEGRFYIFLSCSPLDGFLEGGGPSGHGGIIGM